MTTEENPILVSVTDGVAVITLNRPAVLNALNNALSQGLLAALHDAAKNDAVRVIVIKGAGDAFMAGGDVGFFHRKLAEFPDRAKFRPVIVEMIEHAQALARLIRAIPKPVIAAVHGGCAGFGLSLMLACDLAIASETATFGISEINWGIIPGGNVTKIVSELMTARAALYHIMTGEPFDGAKAAAMGLVNEAVPPERLVARTIELAGVLKAKNPIVLKAAKDAFKRVAEMPFDASEDYLVMRQQALNYMDRSAGREEGMRQFLDEKRFRPGLETYEIKD